MTVCCRNSKCNVGHNRKDFAFVGQNYTRIVRKPKIIWECASPFTVRLHIPISATSIPNIPEHY